MTGAALFAQQPCPDSQALGARLHAGWQKLEQLPFDATAEALALCHRLDSLARLCPEQFADFLVAVNVSASTRAPNYEAWLTYIQRGEAAAAHYGEFLTDSFQLRTILFLRYERCRYHDSMGNVTNAAECYESVWKQLPVQHPDPLLNSFRNALPYSIAECYRHAGDYKQAWDWLNIAREYLDADHPIYPGTILNLEGLIRLARQQPELAKQQFRQAAAAFDRSEQGRRFHQCYRNFADWANLYLTQGKPDSALAILHRAARYDSISDRSWTYLHPMFAKAYLASDSLDNALFHIRQAIARIEKIIPGYYYVHGQALLLLGEVLARQGRRHEALDTLQVAAKHLVQPETDAHWAVNPDPRLSNNKLDLLKLLVLKAGILADHYQSRPGETHLLQWSLETSLAAIDLVKILRAEYEDDEVKEYLSQQSFPIFERAIATASDLFQQNGEKRYLELAFQIMETGKALSLLENLKALEARKFVNLPDSLIGQENDLSYKIARLERELNELGEGPNRRVLERELSGSRRAYRNLIDHFRMRYPQYHQLKYEFQPVSIPALQQRLDDDETLVEYFYGARRLYVAAISRRDIRWHFLPATTGLADTLQTFLTLVSAPAGLTRVRQIEAYQKTGYHLYRQLIAPLNLSTPQLTIIPDGRLHYLPFAALVTDTGRVDLPGKLPFLIRQHRIRRNYSASVLFQQEAARFEEQSPAGKPLLVVSPREFPADSRLSLDSTELVNLFGSQVRIERDVSKERLRRFLREGYENIFFFSHASAEGADPFLQLYQDTLFLRELYATPVRSNLVLLGACETGIGLNRRGEGVLSLARGFAYQNIPNTVMTLWKVRDSQSLQLSVDFLRRHLLEGVEPEEALHQAQLKIIDDPNTYGQPFLWAGFVGVIGE